MPDTQLQWLEEQLRGFIEERQRTSFQVLFVDTGTLTDQAQVLCETLARAWPSSPHGLAAKALVEAANYALTHVLALEEAWQRGVFSEHDTLGLSAARSNRNHDARVVLENAKEAARKAGLG